ncbi:MAG: cation:proton antiporter [Bacilli bacterium]
MLGSLALIFLVGLVFSGFVKKFNIPSLVGMILTGIIIGPYGFNLIDESLLNISEELRKIALVVILLRAGLSLDIKQIKSIGKSAGFLTIVPALFEMVAITGISIVLLDFDLISALILATVISAVSPAVVVPRMISLIEKGKGKVPQLIVASSSIEDVLVISIFAIIINVATTSFFEFITIIYIIMGTIAGIVSGIIIATIISKVFKTFAIIESAKVLTLLGISFLLIAIENNLEYFSSLLAIMTIAILIGQTTNALPLQQKFKELWVGAEIILFVIVGAALNISSAKNDIIYAILIIAIGLSFRSLGVLFSLKGSNLNRNEKIFVIFSFLPKATVQAAIAGTALSLGLNNGQTILNIAVFAILITAPLGAFLIDRYKNILL